MKFNVEEVNKKLYEMYESKVIHLSVNHFGEEMTLISEDNTDYLIYKFLNCYKSDISHFVDYPKDKAYKDLKKLQLPFYTSNWNVELENDLFKIKIDVFPLCLEIWCKDIELTRCKKEECDFVDLK